ncbi:hypothetical protein TWF225_009935 [Orbilia oligospora]|uniref:Uncharacterized protein n=1 Tax=Orbilia oligospora TaxID=2813651 RepID=A0A7C8NYF3_ORBOL|nr:hypothetical protein TWF751_002877 [Orbilia oligospora]KAF3172956.1 hypothetical protein TWF225_009935 [Orbilia oligospora]KAF3239315.1 hypothetical protein TWF128_011822 [Orbilia oligospora]KAF3251656.1 hypothetical protein TWF217_007988 [Orbilia oligospora]TGJ65199.1 hypothetical protein EYR41_009190 [Orbilia oligospora]
MIAPLSPPSRQAVIHAYRNLLRAGLRAVQYSSPARYGLRSKLRHAFSDETAPILQPSAGGAPARTQRFPKTFSQTRIDNTIRFLNTAATRLGMEHTIVKHLCFVEWRREISRLPRSTTVMKPSDWDTLAITFDEYDDTIRMLNETMELELR